MKIIFLLPALLITLSVHSQEKNEMEILWEQTYGGKKNEMVNSIISSKSGAIIIGSKQPENRYDVDLLVIKISNTGEVIWEKTFGDKNLENGYAGIEVENGEIYILGGITKAPNRSDIIVYKLSAQGQLLWAKEYGGTNAELAG